MDHNNYIFPTKLSAAKYVIKNPLRIEYVQYNTLAPTRSFPKLENISRFGSLEEAQIFVRDFGNSEEVLRFDESEDLQNNEAYILLGWFFNPMTGVWGINQEDYHRVMGIISYRLHQSGPARLSDRFPSNFASSGGGGGGGGRLSAASGGGGGGRLSAASGGGGGGRLSAASGGGRLSSVRRLESNINDVLTEFDDRKLTLIREQAHVLSKGGNRLIVKTDNMINKLSEVIAENGFREWTARNTRHAIFKRDKIRDLKNEKRRLEARRDELQLTQRNAALLPENKYEVVHNLEQISGELIRREREIVELSTEQLTPYTFDDIDREIQSLSSDILESIRYIESEETRLGGVPFSYAEKVQRCSEIGIFISDFDKRIKHISLMSASYKAPEYYLEERKNVRKKEIEKKIALLDLWRLSLTYSNTGPGIILSQLNMYESMEDLTALAEYNQGYREDLYKGSLLKHGRGAPIEAFRRLYTSIWDSATLALEGIARVIDAQNEGLGPHDALVSEATPVIQSAGSIVINSLKNFSRKLSRRRTGSNFTSRLPINRNGHSAGGINSRKRRRRLTPPEPPESNNSANSGRENGSANSGRVNGGRENGSANGGRANAGVIPLEQAMNRGSLEEVLAAGNAYNGNLPEVPANGGVAPYGRNAQGRAYAGVNKFGIPFLYSNVNAIPSANQQGRNRANRRNTKKNKNRSP